MGIKFDKDLNLKIRKVVQNYNKRITRLNKKSNLSLPRASIAEIKNRYARRTDLLFGLEQLEMIRGDEKSVEKAFRRRTTRAKRSLNAKIQYYEKITSTYPRPRQNLQLDALKARRNYLNRNLLSMSKSEKKTFETIVNQESVVDKERIDNFYNDFFDMLFANAFHANISNEDANYIQEQLQKLSPEELLKAYHENETIKNLVYNYHEFQEWEAKHSDEFDFETQSYKKQPEIGDPAYDIRANFSNLRQNVDDIVKQFRK